MQLPHPVSLCDSFLVSFQHCMWGLMYVYVQCWCLGWQSPHTHQVMCQVYISKYHGTDSFVTCPCLSTTWYNAVLKNLLSVLPNNQISNIIISEILYILYAVFILYNINIETIISLAHLNCAEVTSIQQQTSIGVWEH